MRRTAVQDLRDQSQLLSEDLEIEDHFAMLRLKPAKVSKRSLSDSEACAVEMEDSFRNCVQTKKLNPISFQSAEQDETIHGELKETEILVLSSTDTNDSDQMDIHGEIPDEIQEMKKCGKTSEDKHEHNGANVIDNSDKNDILEAILGNSSTTAMDLENLESLELPLDHRHVEDNCLVSEEKVIKGSDRLGKNELSCLVRLDADREEGELTPDHTGLTDDVKKRSENKENEKKAHESLNKQSGDNIQTFLNSFCEKAKEYLKSQTENIQSPILDSLNVVISHVENVKSGTARDNKSSCSTLQKNDTLKSDAKRNGRRARSLSRVRAETASKIRRSKSVTKERTENSSKMSNRRSRSITRGRTETTSKTIRRSRSVTRSRADNVSKTSNHRSRSRDKILKTDKFGRIPKRLIKRSRRSSTKERSSLSKTTRNKSKRRSSRDRKVNRKQHNVSRGKSENDERVGKFRSAQSRGNSGGSLGFDRLLNEHRSYHRRNETSRRIDPMRSTRGWTGQGDRCAPKRIWNERIPRDFNRRKEARENRHSSKRKEQDRIQSLVKRQLKIISHIVKMRHKAPRVVERDVLSNRHNTIMLDDDKYRRRKVLGGDNSSGKRNLNSLDDMEAFLNDLRSSNRKKILNNSGACSRLSHLNKQLSDLTTFFDGKDQFVSRDDIDIYKYDFADEKGKKLLYFSSKSSNPDKSDHMGQDSEGPKGKKDHDATDHRKLEKNAEHEKSSGKTLDRQKIKREYSRSDRSGNEGNTKTSPSRRGRSSDEFSESDEIKREYSSGSRSGSEENAGKSHDSSKQNSKNDENRSQFSRSSPSESEDNVKESYPKRKKTIENDKRHYSSSSQSESEEGTRKSHPKRRKFKRKLAKKVNSPVGKQAKKRKRLLDEARTETEQSTNNSSDESSVSMQRRKRTKRKNRKLKRSHMKDEESGSSSEENEESSYGEEKSKRLSRIENSESEDPSDEPGKKQRSHKNNEFRRKKRTVVLKKLRNDERKSKKRRKITSSPEILKVKSKRGGPIDLGDKELAGKIRLKLKSGQLYLKKAKKSNLESDEGEQQIKSKNSRRLEVRSLKHKRGTSKAKRLRVRDSGTTLEDMESFLEELRSKKNETTKADVEFMSMSKLYSREAKFLDRVRAKRKAKLMACMGVNATDKTMAKEAKFLAAMEKRTSGDSGHEEDESNVENERDKSELLQKLNAETKAILLGNKTEKKEMVRPKIKQASPDTMLEDIFTVGKVKKSGRRKKGREGSSYVSFKVKNSNSLANAAGRSAEAPAEAMPEKAQSILNELRRKKKR